MNNDMSVSTNINCRRCGHPRCDLRLLGCGCNLHVRCTPLSIVIDQQDGNTSQQFNVSAIPRPVTTAKALPCPVCRSGYVSGVHLFAMDFADLDRSIELRKRQAKASANLSSMNSTPQSSSSSLTSSNAETHSGSKRPHDEDEDGTMQQIQAESSYLLLSHTSFGGNHGSHNSVGGDKSNNRTGRWTPEEIAFVDLMCSAFDRGWLPLPHGVKLNEFLGDMLLCKSSRLTKKMKNAKLSTRSYTLTQNQTPQGVIPADFYTFSESLSNAQELFLQSIISEPTQMELHFNMTKLWRTHFSNLCLQVGYEALDGRDWLASLEEMERRASEADDLVRKARRQRMCLALRKDVGKAKVNSGIYIQGQAAADIDSTCSSTNPSSTTTISATIAATTTTTTSEYSEIAPTPVSASQNEQNGTTDEPDLEYLSSFLELSNVSGGSGGDGILGTPKLGGMDTPKFGGRSRLNSLDMVEFALDGDNTSSAAPPAAPSDAIANLVTNLGNMDGKGTDCGPFLKQVVGFMQSERVPFQHADIWVPSYAPKDETPANKTTISSDLRLYHAGHATRTDVGQFLSFQLNEYGVYSTNFSFSPGVGLPGRVYATGKPSWESSIDKASPDVFERAGGAKVYGVKTALGVPVDCPDIGRVIVALYSTVNIGEDPELIANCQKAFSLWTPEPKWRLVIEMGETNNGKAGTSGTTGSTTQPTSAVEAAVATTTSSQCASATQASSSSQSQLQTKHPGDPTIAKRILHRSHSMPTQILSSSSSKRTVSASKKPSPIQLICHDHSNPLAGPSSDKATVSNPPLVTSASENIGSSSTITQETVSQEDIDSNLEQQITSLLGTYMPATSSDASADLYPHFMSLRLLLLRSAGRRSAEEVEALDILKKSYQGYSVHRSGAELASLIAKDWMYLAKTTNMGSSQGGTPPQGSVQHHPYVMQLSNNNNNNNNNNGQSGSSPPLIPSSSSGTLPPPAISSSSSSQLQLHPHSVSSYSSFGSVDQDSSTKNKNNERRSGIVSSPSTPLSPEQQNNVPSYNPQANIVPET